MHVLVVGVTMLEWPDPSSFAKGWPSQANLYLLCDEHVLALSAFFLLVQAGDLLFVFLVFFLAEALVMFQ